MTADAGPRRPDSPQRLLVYAVLKALFGVVWILAGITEDRDLSIGIGVGWILFALVDGRSAKRAADAVPPADGWPTTPTLRERMLASAAESRRARTTVQGPKRTGRR